MADVSKNAVLKLLSDLGPVCRGFQDEVLLGLSCRKIQVYEIWAFTRMEQKRIPAKPAGTWGVGDCWTWIAIDAETRLVPSWFVGLWNARTASFFMRDLP
jgi:hypothetical protein